MTNAYDSGEKDSFDITLLKIRGNVSDNIEESKKYIRKTANAIDTVIGKHGEAKLRCVGAASINNAIKAAAMASQKTQDREGTKLLIEAGFGEADFDGSMKTAMILTVRTHEDIVNDKEFEDA